MGLVLFAAMGDLLVQAADETQMKQAAAAAPAVAPAVAPAAAAAPAAAPPAEIHVTQSQCEVSSKRTVG